MAQFPNIDMAAAATRGIRRCGRCGEYQAMPVRKRKAKLQEAGQ